MKGAQILMEALKRAGVKVIFGHPGGAILPVYDALFDEKELRFVLTRHEQGAAHMADGYARATGRAGVCLVTSGPGATNLVTGLATSYMDSTPVVALTGQVRTALIGNDAFQEADVVGITRPITKHNYLVKDTRDLARIVKEAFYIATTGRPGPVLIDIPVDVQVNEAEFEYPDTVNIRGYHPTIEGQPGQIKRAAKAILESKKPIVYVGGGCNAASAAPELREFAEKIQAPVTTTLLGLGSFPETNPLSMKMLGMHGSAYANHAVAQCDLLIAVGARFDDRVTGKVEAFAKNARIIHMDIDPAEINKNKPAHIPIVGDVKSVLRDLNKELDRLGKRPDTAEWLKHVSELRKKYPLKYKPNPNGLKPQYVVESVYKATEGKAIIATDVGQHQMWAAQYYQFTDPHTMITSGGLGTMGFGMPAAIGAKAAFPDKTVVCVTGDGSIQMNSQEFATAVTENLPVIVVIVNNKYLGMVRQWQEIFYKRRYAGSYMGMFENSNPAREMPANFCPDFVKLAEAYGALGFRATTAEECDRAMEAAVKSGKTAIIDCLVDEEENVFPMIPSGKSVDEMIGGLA